MDDDFVIKDDELKDIIGDITLPEVVTKQMNEIDDLKKKIKEVRPTVYNKHLDQLDPQELEREEDFQFVRNNLYEITQKAISSLNTLMQFAEDNKHPRAFEVISSLIKTIADSQKELLSIHETNKKVQTISSPTKQEVTQNNLFIGTTDDLDKFIKEIKGTKTEVIDGD